MEGHEDHHWHHKSSTQEIEGNIERTNDFNCNLYDCAESSLTSPACHCYHPTNIYIYPNIYLYHICPSHLLSHHLQGSSENSSSQIPFSNGSGSCLRGNCWLCRCTLPKGHSMYTFRVTYLTGCCAVEELCRGLSYLLSSSPYTPRISSTTQGPVICRSSL